MTRLKNWIREWLGIEALEAETAARKQDVDIAFGILRDSMQKQLEDLRRILTVQEKPKVRVQAASFREVRQFVGGEDSD
jgi:hypothetical protein